MAMGIDKARAENAIEMLYIIAGFRNSNDINNFSTIICYEHISIVQQSVAGKKLVCIEFSVQNDWLRWCKFAAASLLSVAEISGLENCIKIFYK